MQPQSAVGTSPSGRAFLPFSFGGLTDNDDGNDSNYTIAMTAPPGYEFDDYGTTETQSLVLAYQTVYASAYLPTVYGTVRDEGAGNGGLAGVAITLTDSTGANFTATTNGCGGYEIQGMALGSYTIAATALPGYAFNGGNTSSGSAGSYANENDFSAYHSANITIKVTDDGTGNGLAGVGVGLDLWWSSLNPSDVTAGNGTVTFTGLAPGTYDVGATLPGNMAFDQTGFDDWDGYWNGSMGSIDLQPGENLSIDWSAYTPTTLAGTAMASIGDGNVPLAGVSVALLNSNGMPATDNYGDLYGAIETDANGTYSIADLAPGNYTAEFVAPPGYLLTNGSDNDVPGYSQPLTIVSGNGTEVANVTAVLAEPRTISGEVYDDYDGSGTLQDYDDGVACATVKLINDSGNAVQTITTDSSGNYAFTNEPTSCYTIQVVAPDGYFLDGPSAANVTISNITISNTTADAFYSNVTLNIGAYQPTTAQGTVFEDLNVDGEQDDGEPGIEDATVELEDANGNAVIGLNGDGVFAFTDGNGNFSFANISPGYYQLAFTSPSGYTMNGPAANVTQALTVYSGDGTDYANAPAYGNQPVTIDGNVFLDVNGDYENDDDEGLGEVTISLTDAEGDPVTDRAGSTVANITTTDDGNFSFGNLTPGNYTLTMTAPDGYLLENVDDSGNATGNTTYETSIEAYPDTDNTVNEGAYQATSLGGEVFLDQNDDELLDDGENGLANVTVSLVDEYGDPAVDVNGNAIAPVETDAFGNYAFTNLAPGTYTIQFETDGDYVFANDLTTDEQTEPITSGLGNLSINEAAYAADQPSTVAGEVYLDLNNDDELDPGDPGLGNVTVTLLTADGSALATDAFGDTFSSIYTLSNGTFAFANVLPGTYSLEFTAPANYTMDGANTTIYQPLNVLPTGDDPLEVPAYQMDDNETVSGTVFTLEEEGWWIPHLDAFGVANITVDLEDAEGDVLSSVKTDDYGYYSFGNLTAGNYSVTFTAPTGILLLDSGNSTWTGDVTTPGLNAVLDEIAFASSPSVLDNVESDFLIPVAFYENEPPNPTPKQQVENWRRSNNYTEADAAEVKKLEEELLRLERTTPPGAPGRIRGGDPWPNRVLSTETPEYKKAVEDLAKAQGKVRVFASIWSLSSDALAILVKNGTSIERDSARDELNRRNWFNQTPQQKAQQQNEIQIRERKDALPRTQTLTEVIQSRIGKTENPGLRFVLGLTKAAAGNVEGTVELAVIAVAEPKKLQDAAVKIATDGELRQKIADAIYEKIKSGKAEDIGQLYVEIPLAVTGAAGVAKTGFAIIRYSYKVTPQIIKAVREGSAASKRLLTELWADDIGAIKFPPGKDAPKNAYKFEKAGITYESQIVKNADGSTSISHYATKDGNRQLVGVSEITRDGQLTNAFEVPKEMQQLELSKRMYAEAESIGFKSVGGQYHASSDNFKQFFNFYDAQKANAVEALYQTPAGKVAKSQGLKPTNIKITGDKIEVTWVKE